MSDLISALLLWIGVHSDYTVLAIQPNIAMVEPYQLCQRYGVQEQQQCKAIQVRGLYDKEYTIYLRYDFDSANIEDRARLLHELVHWVQWSNNRTETNHCMGALEVEAYRLQDQWRASYGLSPKRDAFTMLMLEASCST